SVINFSVDCLLSSFLCSPSLPLLYSSVRSCLLPPPRFPREVFMLSRFVPAALALSLVVGSSVAQPPPSILPVSPQAPTLNLPQPLGAAPGSSVELTLTGTNLTEPLALLSGLPAKVTFPTDANNGKDPAKLRVKL